MELINRDSITLSIHALTVFYFQMRNTEPELHEVVTASDIFQSRSTCSMATPSLDATPLPRKSNILGQYIKHFCMKLVNFGVLTRTISYSDIVYETH